MLVQTVSRICKFLTTQATNEEKERYPNHQKALTPGTQSRKKKCKISLWITKNLCFQTKTDFNKGPKKRIQLSKYPIEPPWRKAWEFQPILKEHNEKGNLMERESLDILPVLLTTTLKTTQIKRRILIGNVGGERVFFQYYRDSSIV